MLPLKTQYQACKKLQNSQYPSITPVIFTLSSYLNQQQQQTVVTLNGANYRYFSKVQLDTFTIDIIYISSDLINFNVPRDLPAGLYPISVLNDTIASNTVEFLYNPN